MHPRAIRTHDTAPVVARRLHSLRAMGGPSPANASRLLRYRFDSASQLLRHFHVADGRVLLFFPARCTSVSALLELDFHEPVQQVTVPALVHAHTARGEWLELRALSSITGLRSPSTGSRRRSRRLGAELLAYVQRASGPMLACPLLDISESGAHLWGIPGDPPEPGEELCVRVPTWPPLRARVAWGRAHEAGVSFAPESREEALHLYASVEALWAHARAAAHAVDCPCFQSGHDPEMPPGRQRGRGAA